MFRTSNACDGHSYAVRPSPDLTGLTPAYLAEVKAGQAVTTKRMGSYDSGNLTSKMWILPDGKAVSIGQQHYQWLQGHPQVAAKFNLDVAALPDDDNAVRLAAINKGFVRVNYDYRGGRLTVEANRRYWTSKIKDAIFVLVADNVGAVDNMVVNLLNDTAMVAQHGYAQLFNYSDEEKLEHLPLISESARGRGLVAVSRAVRALLQ